MSFSTPGRSGNAITQKKMADVIQKCDRGLVQCDYGFSAGDYPKRCQARWAEGRRDGGAGQGAARAGRYDEI
jgi:hypothetical protein